MLKEYTCIFCPQGCDIEATIEDSAIISIEGLGCPKGASFVRQELTDPQRTVSTSVLVQGGILPLASVRLTKAVPKARIFDVLEVVRNTALTAPLFPGQVAIKDVLGLGCDLIVTKHVPVKTMKKENQ